jgi:hypothetical protein
MACQEMELYYAYLDAIEEERRKSQPWQCEVTVFPQEPERQATTTPVPPGPKPAAAAKPQFVCDDPE